MLRKSGFKVHEVKIGVLNDFKNQMTQDYVRYNDWRISKSKLTNGLILEKAFHKGNIFSDNIYFIEKFLHRLYDREFTSILCGGLGLGVAPYMCQSFCDTVDVIEIDSDLVQLINTAGYLSQNVNIIQGDVLTFQPQQKYDVILVDIWQNELGDFQSQAELIKQKYIPHLNEGGLLYLPLEDMLLNP